MTWISLVCLFVFTTSAFGRSAYGGGYGSAPIQPTPQLLVSMRDLPVPTSSYGQPAPMLPTFPSIPLTRTLPTTSYGQSYGEAPVLRVFDQPQAPVHPLTPADTLCQGQVAETVIPLDNGSRFVVCLDDSKGVEQECPKGLLYQVATKRCERKWAQPTDFCYSQPCLNGGQCVSGEFSYQCQCAPGFDGHNCELDARICQSQQPCGSSPDSKCQSFRLGAALQYICLFQGGYAYGLSAQQVIPTPCHGVDGPQALSVSRNGFILCDGDRLHVESCPGGTLWDDVEKACTWPDQQTPSVGQYSYGQEKMLPKTIDSYGSKVIIPKTFDLPKVDSYGAKTFIPPVFDEPKPVESYGTKSFIPPVFDLPKVDSYGAKTFIPKTFDLPKIDSYGTKKIITPFFDVPKSFDSYGSKMIIPKTFDEPKPIDSYGAKTFIPKTFDLPKVDSYGAKTFIPPVLDLPRPVIPRTFDLPKVDSYGAKTFIPKTFDLPRPVESFSSKMIIPRTFEQPKPVTSYGSQVLLPEQPEHLKSFPIPERDEFVSMKQGSGY